MDKSSDQIKKFEAILRTYSEKKRLALYNADENRTLNWSTKVLEPKDVLAAVSNQLRDIQKADSLRKDNVRYNTAKSKQRQEFVPISVLASKGVTQPQEVTKFETQYVTDTQLVEVVDSVEAMVNVDKLKHETQMNLEHSSAEKHILKLCGIESDNENSDNLEVKQLCNRDRQMDLCIDDINTEICAEFNVAYSKNDDSTFVIKDKENPAVQDVRECPSDVVRKRKQSYCDWEDNDTNYSNIKTAKTFDKLIENKYKSNPATKTGDNSDSNNTNKNQESCSYFKSNLEQIDTDSDLTSEINFSPIKDMPRSPVLKIFKVKGMASTPSQLVFPLDLFEKFESLVWPLVEENLDFGEVKQLISSQLIRPSNAVFVLERSVDNIIPIIMNSNVDEKLTDIDVNKNDQSKTNSTEKRNEHELSFKDEILFSSDEENEYFHYCAEDLPMTCALNATRNETKVDLDESIFVGFQISSNKCIQVCKDSFVKAQQIFNSINDKECSSLTLTEAVDVYDSKISTINNNLPSKPVSDRECTDTKDNITSTKHTDSICVKEYDYDKNLAEQGTNTFQTIQVNSLDVSNNKFLESKTYFSDIRKNNVLEINDDTRDVNYTSQKREFIGFKTASNKKIKLSEESLAKSSNIFKDIELDLNNPPLDIPFKLNNAVQENVKVTQDHIYSRCDNTLDKNNVCDDDDHISIVDQTLLQEFENDSIEEHLFRQKYLDRNALATFPNEMKTIVKTSDTHFKNIDYISMSNGISHSDLNFDPGISKQFNNRNKEITCTFGFKTANNKEIKISKAALAKTKDLFNDITFDDIKCKKGTIDNNTDLSCNDDHIGSVNRVTECANIDSNINNNLATESEPCEEDNKKPCVFQGFKTASNKPVQISKEAISKVKNIFQDIDAEFDTSKSCKSNSNEGNANKSIHNSLNNNNNLCFKSKTMSDEKIVTSEDAFVETKRIFKESVSENPNSCKSNFDGSEKKPINNAVVENYSCFQGFKTASDKQVIISEDALAKTKEIFKELIFENPDLRNSYDEIEEKKFNHTSIRDKYSSFQGFKTASDKHVVISEDALAKTKDIFNEPMFENPNLCNRNSAEDVEQNFNYHVVTKGNLGFTGFKTASDKKVIISEDALAKTKHVFKDIEIEASALPQSKYKDNKAKGTEKLFPPMASPMISEQENVVAFKGFQTASNKSVTISDEVLAKSRKIFEEINFDTKNKERFREEVCSVNKENINKENMVKKCQDAEPPVPFGFRTATNKFIKIPEDALKKSRQLLDFDNNLKSTKRNIDEIKVKEAPVLDAKTNIAMDNIINTQVLNNFEVSLQTEDFFKDTSPSDTGRPKTKQQHCKRSGSPILSCTKAKKRKKFEAPYRHGSNVTNIENTECKINKINLDFKYKFTDDYKKIKLHTLKELDVMDTNYDCDTKIDPYILNFDYDTLLKFEFEGSRNDYTDAKWTTDNIKACFVESVNRKIIPEGWLDNHLKLIIWKLISYEIRFPNVMKGACSVKNVLEQLKYRYDKELYRVERPALRKMLEKDDVSTRTMVLAVVGIYVNGVKVQSVTDPSSTVELLVTDGWYSVLASTDRMLARLVTEGRVAVGRKIATSGAEMMNNSQGVSPWEDISSVRLQLFGNSTRPARWHATLGHAAATVSSALCSIEPAGGKVSKARVLVARVYPALYIERLEGGSTVTRSERLENRHQMRYETEKQIQLEKLYEEVEKEFFDRESSGSDGIDLDLRRSFQGGSQLKRCMTRSGDATQFRSHLTESQSVLMQEYSSRKKERVLEELQRRVQEEMQSRGLQAARNVVPLLKIRVAGLEGVENGVVSKATISIWRPSDAILEVVREGTWLDVYNIVPTAIRNSELQMSAGRQSIFSRSKHKESDKMKPLIESLKRKCFTPRELNKNPSLKTEFNEIDTFGIVFLTEPKSSDFEPKKHQFQNVFLTDLDKNFVCLNFWGGTKKFGYESIFETGNIVACLNLQKRFGNTRRHIPQYRATELSVFTESPKLDLIRNVILELNKNMTGLDLRKFCEDCVSIKNNYDNMRHTTDYSPYRFNTSDHNLTKNKVFIDSPLAENKDANFNLTGLDFESTFRQTDTQNVSPAVLRRKQLVKEKIARLKMYGEPPPLSKIHILNQSKNAGSAYKSPLSVTNVATVNNFPQSPATSKTTQSSPILSPNRTFVVRPGINPVKLNFSSNSLGDEKVESNPFAEEFDPSPPLSLD